MKKMNVFNPIYDEIVKEVENGIIKPGINRDFDNYKLRMDNIESGNFTRGDILALLIIMNYGSKEADTFINGKVDKIVKKLDNNEELEESELKFFSETREALKESAILSKLIFSRSVYEIPESLRSLDVILNLMFCQDTFEYIKDNIEKFDRQCFKDIIATNFGFILCCFEDNNIFSIMPLEYIDEEMCLLAVLKDNGGGYWFREVYKRKPEVLTERLWKLAARFYVFKVQDAIDLMRVIPKEYKDYEFYQELCSRGSYFFGAKENVTDTIPPEILTPEFLLELILKQSDNVSTFSESALNTELSYTKYLHNLGDDSKKTITTTKKAWQMALLDNAENIWYVQPDDEKLKFFLHYYPKGSEEYEMYIVGEENKTSKEKPAEEKPKEPNSISDSVGNAIGEILRESKHDIERLPRKYIGELFDVDVNPEEYLFKIYEKMGIIFDDNYDTVGPNNYLALLPEGWKVVEPDSQRPKLKIDQFLKKRNKRLYTLINENGEMVLVFSRISDGQSSNSFVEIINYEKVEEAYNKSNNPQDFNK